MYLALPRKPTSLRSDKMTNTKPVRKRRTHLLLVTVQFSWVSSRGTEGQNYHNEFCARDSLARNVLSFPCEAFIPSQVVVCQCFSRKTRQCNFYAMLCFRLRLQTFPVRLSLGLNALFLGGHGTKVIGLQIVGSLIPLQATRGQVVSV